MASVGPMPRYQKRGSAPKPPINAVAASDRAEWLTSTNTRLQVSPDAPRGIEDLPPHLRKPAKPPSKAVK